MLPINQQAVKTYLESFTQQWYNLSGKLPQCNHFFSNNWAETSIAHGQVVKQQCVLGSCLRIISQRSGCVKWPKGGKSKTWFRTQQESAAASLYRLNILTVFLSLLPSRKQQLLGAAEFLHAFWLQLSPKRKKITLVVTNRKEKVMNFISSHAKYYLKIFFSLAKLEEKLFLMFHFLK